MNRKKVIKKIESLIRKLDDIAVAQWEIQKYHNDIFRLIDKIKPDYLYKYKCCKKRNFDDLVQDKLYMNTVSQFNDPTESMAYTDPDELVRLALSIDGDAYVFDNDESNDTKHLLLRTKLMNDGLQYIKACRDKVRIACLSEVYDSTLMWAHYADKHKGFAIRYKVNDFRMSECDKCRNPEICWRPGNMICPAIYKNHRYDATMMAFATAIAKNTNLLQQIGWKSDDVPIPLLTILQKEEVWQYEKEWRIICKDLINDYIHIVPDGLLLGDQISCQNALELAKIARQKNIGLYKMQIDYFNPDFALVCDDWTGYSDDTIKDCFEKDENLEVK